MPTLDETEIDEIKNDPDLGRRLGMLHAQTDRGTANGATIRYLGEVAATNTRLITASFAAGWLKAALEEQVNLVNAEELDLFRERSGW
jgi:D-3-phosphoglycerate dehydrogenase